MSRGLGAAQANVERGQFPESAAQASHLRGCEPGRVGAVRAHIWPWVQSPVPHVWARPAGSSLGRDWGPWVNLQELWVLPGFGLQGPTGSIRLVLSPSPPPHPRPCSSRLGGEPLPSDNSSSLWISKSTSLRSGQFSFRLAFREITVCTFWGINPLVTSPR